MFHNLLKVIITVVVGFCAACSAPIAGSADPERVAMEEQQALEVVAKRTDAYNAHDIESFIAIYDKNVAIYEYPNKLLGRGSERMRKIFGPQFTDNVGEIITHSRHALANRVISDETVTIYGETEHNIGIYTIEDGLIVEVRLIESVATGNH